MFKYFGIILGSNPDIHKVKELEHYISDYDLILKRNNITVNRFIGIFPKRNCDLLKLIKNKWL